MNGNNRGRGRGKTSTPEKIWEEFLSTGTFEYWLDICQRAVIHCQKQILLCQSRKQPVPKALRDRFNEYNELINYAAKELMK